MKRKVAKRAFVRWTWLRVVLGTAVLLLSAIWLVAGVTSGIQTIVRVGELSFGREYFWPVLAARTAAIAGMCLSFGTVGYSLLRKRHRLGFAAGGLTLACLIAMFVLAGVEAHQRARYRAMLDRLHRAAERYEAGSSRAAQE